MTQVTARRSFLSGRFQDRGAMRPFGAVPTMTFEDLCTGCGDCARACPERLIQRDTEGFPVVNLLRGECTFCAECTKACEVGALQSENPWLWQAQASPSCLSENGVQCRACQDHCPEQAIRFRLAPGGRSKPEINTDTCTGCGACAAPCPVGAITFIQTSQPVEACLC